MLSIEFEGEQETYDTNGGVEVYIKLAIEIDITTPTHTDEIEMTYTNDNKDVEKETSTNIKFKSKYGLMIYDTISNYNEAGDDVEVINDEETTIELDKDAESKELEITTYLINNHDKEIENVVYIGTIPSENDNNTFTATLNSVKTNNKDVKMYYSTNIDATEDDESWTEDSTDAVAYKLVVDKMESQETIKISTKITIPANLGTNQEGEITQSVSYLYNEAEQTRSATIGLMTEYEIVLASASLAASLGNGITTEVAEGLDVTIYAVSANEELSDGDSIYEGQTVKYYITIENNTGEDLSNVSVSATQTNGKVWGIDVRNEYNPVYGEYGDYYYYDKLATSELEIDTIDLANGNSTVLEYEAYANNLEDCDGTTMYGTIEITTEDKIINTNVKTIENEIIYAEIILKVIQTEPIDEELNVLKTDSALQAQLQIDNNTKETLYDIDTTIVFSSNFSIDEYSIYYEEEIYINNIETDSSGNVVVNLRIIEIAPESSITIGFTPIVNSMDVDIKNELVSIYSYSICNSKTYYSNILTETAYNTELNLAITQDVSVNGESLTDETVAQNEDNLEFIIEITNNENEDITCLIEDIFETAFTIESATLLTDESEVNIIDSFSEDSNYLGFTQEISSNSTLTITVSTILNTNLLLESNFSNTISVYCISNYKTYENTISINAEIETDLTSTKEEDEENNNDNNGDDTDSQETNNDDTSTDNNNSSSSDNNNDDSTSTETDENTTSDDNYYNISGIIWNDSDEDGQRDSSEDGISGITVRVIDVSSGEIIDSSTSTGSDGTYSLSLEEGTYIIVFLYDTSIYSITTYQASGVSDDVNSDAIKDSIEIDGETQTVATTDNINLTSDTTNIDLGLIESSEANLSIAKYVTQIIVENSTGTKTYTQDDEETLAKVEIGSKVISGSNVTVEYVIEITNSGEQSGDIGTIVDYLPSELSFSTSSNSGWYESGDYIYNDSLENEEIDPGETKEVTLILTKTMTDSNTGLINNKTGLLSSDGEAEISTASADIMIGIKTGTVITCISLIIIILLVILIAIYVINEKHILEKMFLK